MYKISVLILYLFLISNLYSQMTKRDKFVSGSSDYIAGTLSAGLCLSGGSQLNCTPTESQSTSYSFRVKANQGTTAEKVSEITILDQNQPLVVFHYKNGCSSSFPLSSITKIRISGIVNGIDQNKFTKIIEHMELFQNYPNPFNPVTIINYTIPEAGIVSIKIYNINGQLIRDLVNEIAVAGIHKIMWDARDNNDNAVSSGIYFYQINYNHSFITKKMIFIK